MWLTSWWVAWLLNFYGFSHTNCMVFYRTPWTRYGIPWNCIGTSGNPMAFHGTPRYSMEFQDIPWNSMAFHGTPWILHGTPWHSMELHGYSMGVSWNSMDFHRFPWNSMDFHRFPWNSMEVFHTGKLGVTCSYFLVDVTIRVIRAALFWTSCRRFKLRTLDSPLEDIESHYSDPLR